MRHPQPARLVIKFLAILPAALIALLILRDGVDFPFQDQWVIAPFFAKLAKGTLTFTDLFALQNEHRQLFPNLIFLALGRLTHWNVKIEMWLTFLLVCLISYNVSRLGARTLNEHPWQSALAFLFANIFIFTPLQFDNWLNGEQLIYFMPIACLTMCLTIARSEKLSLRKKFLLSMCLATISTFSCANGMLCWALALPVLAWSKSWSELLRDKRWLILLWLIGFAFNLAVYFHGYHKPETYPNPLEPLAHPLSAIIYFLAFLGSTLTLGLGIFSERLAVGFGRGVIAIGIGATLTALFLLSCFYAFKHRRDEALVSSLLGWLMMGAYSLITALLITFGRTGFGAGHALLARYTTFSLYLLVALLYLAPLIFNDAEARGYLVRRKRRVTQLTVAAATLLIFLQLPVYPVSFRQANSWRKRTLQAQACTLFVNVAPNKECLTEIHPNGRYVQQTANDINELKLLKPPLIQSHRVADIAGGEAATAATTARDYGSFDSLTTAGDGIYVASGRASLPWRNEAADAVVLAYRNAAGDDIIFALATTGTEKDFITLAFRKTGINDPRWQATFKRTEIPQDAGAITAWAFDAQTGKLFPLSGTQQLP